MCIYVIQNPCIKYLDNVFIFWCLPRLWQISQSGASLLFSACLYASIAAKLNVIKTKAPQEQYDLYMKSLLLSYPACASQAETGSGPSAWCYPHCWGWGCCKPRPGTRDISNTHTITTVITWNCSSDSWILPSCLRIKPEGEQVNVVHAFTVSLLLPCT